MPRSRVAAIVPALPTADLRSPAKDHRRVKQHTTKWAHGAREAPGNTCQHNGGRMYKWETPCQDCAGRPCTGTRHWQGNTPTRRKSSSRRSNTTRYGVRDEQHGPLDSSDSSHDDEVTETSVAPSPSTDIMYSYDAYAGPNHGSQILGHAIAQAVTRFENQETDKIVREYDMVADGQDDEHPADTEDDFEVISATHL